MKQSRFVVGFVSGLVEFGALALCVGVMSAATPTVARAFAPVLSLEPDAHTRVAPVSATGAPRTLVTLTVPVPSQLADATTLEYRVEPRANVEIIES